MQIIITTSEDRATEYAELVAAQIADGYTSGHEDRYHHWTTEGGK
jgi:hypothetical protein